MRNLILLIFLFSLVTVAKAQNNYREGFIITNKNDTIKGFIDFRANSTNGGECKFRLSQTSDVQMFHPYDILGYMFVNEKKFYVSRTITLNNLEKKVFLEYLVQGMKDLYFYDDDDIHYYLVEDSDGKLVPITKDQGKMVGDKFSRTEKYKGKLLYVFRDCPSLNEKINNGIFDRKLMVDLARKYHQQMCTTGQECIVFENDYKQKFTKVYFSVYGGMQDLSHSLKNGWMVRFNPLKHKSPVIGGEINVNDSRFLKWFFLQLGVSFSNFSSEGGGYEGNSATTDYLTFRMKGKFVNWNVGGKFSCFTGRIRPFVEGGLVIARYINKTLSVTTTAPGQEDKSVTIIDNTRRLTSTLYGYYAGGGCSFQIDKRRAVYIAGDVSRYSSTVSNISSSWVKVGVVF